MIAALSRLQIGEIVWSLMGGGNLSLGGWGGGGGVINFHRQA